MPTETEIANLALQHLGESRINAIDDDGDKVSRTCKVNFAQARDEALQSARWACAKKFARLSMLAEMPMVNWSAGYQLPDDFLRLIEINGVDAWMPMEFFDRFGDTLVTGRGGSGYDIDGADTLVITYIHRLTDCTRFDPLLVDVVSMLLAMKCARTLTGSDSKAAELRREYETIVLPRALMANAAPFYSGKNNPLRQILNKSVLSRSRRSGGFGDDLSGAANPPAREVPRPELVPDLDGAFDSNL